MLKLVVDDHIIYFQLNGNGLSWTLRMEDEIEYKCVTDFKPLKPCREEQIAALLNTHSFELKKIDSKWMLSCDVPMLAHTYIFELKNENLELMTENKELKAKVAELEKVVVSTSYMRENEYYCKISIIKANNCNHFGRGCGWDCFQNKFIKDGTIGINYGPGRNEFIKIDGCIGIDLINLIVKKLNIRIDNITLGYSICLYCDFGACQEFLDCGRRYGAYQKYIPLNVSSGGYITDTKFYYKYV